MLQMLDANARLEMRNNFIPGLVMSHTTHLKRQKHIMSHLQLSHLPLKAGCPTTCNPSFSLGKPNILTFI